MDLLLRKYTNISDDVINHVLLPYTDCCYGCKRKNKCNTTSTGLLKCLVMDGKNPVCGKLPKIIGKRFYSKYCSCLTDEQREMHNIMRMIGKIALL